MSENTQILYYSKHVRTKKYMKIRYMNKTNTSKLTKSNINSKSRAATTPGNMAVSTSDPENRKAKVQNVCTGYENLMHDTRWFLINSFA